MFNIKMIKGAKCVAERDIYSQFTGAVIAREGDEGILEDPYDNGRLFFNGYVIYDDGSINTARDYTGMFDFVVNPAIEKVKELKVKIIELELLIKEEK